MSGELGEQGRDAGRALREAGRETIVSLRSCGH